MSSLRHGGSEAMSSNSSVVSCSSSNMNSESLPANKYLMKTLCLHRKATSMPSKDEYSKLLMCGLGARKWQVSLDFDAENFTNALMNIYPRLSTVNSYSLWSINKEKNFERLPQKGPPRQYDHSSEPPRSRGPSAPPRSASSPPPHAQTRCPPIEAPSHPGTPIMPPVRTQVGPRFPPGEPSGSNPAHTVHHQHHTPTTGNIRQLCLICGRVAKQIGSSAFYSIDTQMFATEAGHVTIGSRLREILRVDLLRKKFVPSEEICKKCFRQLNEVDYLETQLRNTKDDLIHSFFNTVSKISRVDPAMLQYPPSSHLLPPNTTSVEHHPSHTPVTSGAPLPLPPGPSPPPIPPLVDPSVPTGPPFHPFSNHLNHVSEVGVPQRVYLTAPPTYQASPLGAPPQHGPYPQAMSPQGPYVGSREISTLRNLYTAASMASAAFEDRARASSPTERREEGSPGTRLRHPSARGYISPHEDRHATSEGKDINTKASSPRGNYDNERAEEMRNYSLQQQREAEDYVTHNRRSQEKARDRIVRELVYYNSSSSGSNHADDDARSNARDTPRGSQNGGSMCSGSSSHSGSRSPRSEAGEEGGSSPKAEQSSSPRQRWKKRYRELDDKKDQGQDLSSKKSRMDEPSNVRSSEFETHSMVSTNPDSGMGGSDEDSSGSTTSEQGRRGRMKQMPNVKPEEAAVEASA